MSPVPDCRAFRRRLEERLAGRVRERGLTDLSWHQHLYGCGACRGLLEREEALEVLLASLPEPHLPRDLAERVLARLRRGSEFELDRLLELDQSTIAPSDLAQRVLAGLATSRGAQPASASISPVPASITEQQLDRWLDQAGRVEVPLDLGRRILAGLERQRGRPLRRASFARRPFLVAAASLLLAAGLWVLWPAGRGVEPGQEGLEQVARGPQGIPPLPSEPVALPGPEPEPELLALLDLLAEDLLWDDDVDLDLAASISLAARDELLLEFGTWSPAQDPAGEEEGG